MKLDGPLVLATKNKGKIAEFRNLFEKMEVSLKSLDDFGPIPEVVEDGETFEDNAVKKARFTARVLGLPAIADDSGLVVEALGGRPGVYSSRYAGEDATDVVNNCKLLKDMEGVRNREAYFACVLAIAVPQGPALIYEGKCHGVIAQEMTGSQGFGYDPLFYHPPSGKTFAEMSSEEKNHLSHRGMAMLELKREADKVLVWLKQRLKEETF
ncbi:MAG: XTP/dITP diphosphatase [Desulfobulbaceae bacterium]|nr:XTP/dITP diphosphatase [Desulfobulbaceae bacterium]